MSEYEMTPDFQDAPVELGDNDYKDGVDADTHVSTEVHNASFDDLNFAPEITRAIAENGFEQPSEVQRRCIPVALTGEDVLCQAKSGMGKTAVFVLSVLQCLNEDIKTEVDEDGKQIPNKSVRCLVLCHTRELAYQIKQEFDRFKRHLKATESTEELVETKVFFGGTSVAADKTYLKRTVPHIVIGTPGRVHHLVKDRNLNVESANFLVFDECDQMLGPGSRMRIPIQNIFMTMSRKKQVMMFSATLNKEIREVCKLFMVKPHEVIIDEGKKLSLHGLHQYYHKCEDKDKTEALTKILDDVQFNHVFVFVSSAARALALERLLKAEHFPAAALVGAQNQDTRMENFKNFKSNKGFRIMVSTDLCGRGVDFSNVNLVINYDMPGDAESYLHRVGRAGRFGTRGVTVAFVSSDEDEQVLEDVRKKFTAVIPEAPESIDPSTYRSSM